MANNEPTAELVQQFSEPDATARTVVGGRRRARSFGDVLALDVRRDGRPHVTPLPAMWRDGKLHFCTGAAEQKARNLEGNASCVLTVPAPTRSVRGGPFDVVVGGDRANGVSRQCACSNRWRRCGM